jgi:hypothetical protein
MGTLIAHQDRPLYSFFNADRIWDFLLSIGMRPFVELSFMPEILASGPETVFRFRGNVTPPADYDAWATLIRKLVGHWVDRYGIGEVCQWFFEVWNEPNLPAFWTGTQDDYFTLYGHTAQAIKSVGASLRVGGPATAMTAWIAELLDYCEKNRLPADFISTHIYPTDPLGFEGADTEEQLANSPRNLMRDRAKLVREYSPRRWRVHCAAWVRALGLQRPRNRRSVAILDVQGAYGHRARFRRIAPVFGADRPERREDSLRSGRIRRILRTLPRRPMLSYPVHRPRARQRNVGNEP